MSLFINFAFVFVVFVLVRNVDTLFIEGCPMYGCRPSGSFSFYLDMPKSNVSLKWESSFVLDPVPEALGCVANRVSVICPSNGPFKEDQGYISLFNSNGTIRWRDQKLHFPTLPLLDNFGDVTGSDGIKLVHYDVNGKQYPTIDCSGLAPIFSLAIVGNSYLLLVSHKGLVVVRQTNGVPVGTLTLTDTIKGVKGKFVSITQPVVNVQRFYLLTQFQPINETDLSFEPDTIRLYAVDVHESITNRISVAWHYDVSAMNARSETEVRKFLRTDHSNSAIISSLIWNRYNQTVYVNLNSPDVSQFLLGVRDNGNSGELIFQTNMDVINMAMFVSDHCSKKAVQARRVNEIASFLWVTTRDSKVIQVSPLGNINRVIDIESVLKGSIEISSKLSVVRNSDTDGDILVFGLISKKNERVKEPDDGGVSLLVALDTSSGDENMVLWTYPVPGNMTVLGQIAGASGNDVEDKDQIIIYAENPGKSAKIFNIF